MWRAILGAAALLSLTAGPAAAIPDADWAYFRAKSYAKQEREPDLTDWEANLYRAMASGPSSDAILDAFGAQVGASREQAHLYARALILGVRFREGCARDGGCDSTPGSADWDTIRRAGQADQTGRLLISVGENVGSWGPTDNPVALLDMVQRHPARLEILSSLHAYNERPAMLAALIAAGPGDPRTVAAVGWDGAEVNDDPEAWSGWMDAALEWGLARLEADLAPVDDRAIYVRAILLRRLMMGRTDAALSLWDGLDPDLRSRLPLMGPPCVDEYRGRQVCTRRIADEQFADEMAAALWLAGRRDEARELLDRVTRALGEEAERTGSQRHEAIVDAMTREHPTVDLFEFYINGGPAGPVPRRGGGLLRESSDWLSVSYGAASLRLVEARARDAGYTRIADAFAGRRPFWRSAEDEAAQAVMARASAIFPADLLARQRIIKSELDALRPAEADRSARLAAGQAPDGPPEGWAEQPLPTGVATWPANRRAEALPEGLALPVDEEAVVRHEVVGGEHVILYLSSDLDMPGETPAYGYWLRRTVGGQWTAPLYLGLQNYFPYVATSGSDLPLIADGNLQIEVRVSQIDTRSISFPPVGLTVARREDGVFISTPLAFIERDTDGDGVTDIVERRLGLDPANDDTDRDKMPDGADPLPLTPFNPNVPLTQTALARAVISKIAPEAGGGNMLAPIDEGASDSDRLSAALGTPGLPRDFDTVILEADPTLFSGLAPTYRLMVYGPGELDRLTKGGVPFYPPSVTLYSSLDGLTHLVIWSARWVGGSFIARCPADGSACVIQEKSSWIT